MTQYVTIVLAIEDMTKFDVEFKSEIHGGKVVGMAKYDALAVADKACVALKACVDDGIIDYSVLDEINENKRGNQWLATGRCDKCDDELISLGIQADKDKIAELEAFRDATRACLDGYSFEQIEKHACKILKGGI